MAFLEAIAAIMAAAIAAAVAAAMVSSAAAIAAEALSGSSFCSAAVVAASKEPFSQQSQASDGEVKGPPDRRPFTLLFSSLLLLQPLKAGSVDFINCIILDDQISVRILPGIVGGISIIIVPLGRGSWFTILKSGSPGRKKTITHILPQIILSF